jgi:tetratricopeptide repeat protein 21B
MIDIYLNPELDLYYTLVEESARQIDPENLRACDMILRELSVRGS